MVHVKPYIFALIVIGLAVMAHLSLNYFNATSDLPYYGQQIDGQYPTIPEFQFIDQDSVRFDNEVISDKIVVANYFFTSCPTICPKMNRNMQKVHDLYRDKKEVHLASFSVDPVRDQPHRLKKYARIYNANTDQWHFVTGSKKDLYSFARSGLFISATKGNGGPDDFIHSENLVLIDRNGFIRGYYVGTDSDAINQLIHDITKLLKSDQA